MIVIKIYKIIICLRNPDDQKRIEDNKINITGIDALDMTPLLDIKPYMEKLDSKKGAGNGWADNGG